MSTTENPKISRKQLANIMGVCYNTACKEYKIIQACLGLDRPLFRADFEKYGLM